MVTTSKVLKHGKAFWDYQEAQEQERQARKQEQSFRWSEKINAALDNGLRVIANRLAVKPVREQCHCSGCGYEISYPGAPCLRCD